MKHVFLMAVLLALVSCGKKEIVTKEKTVFQNAFGRAFEIKASKHARPENQLARKAVAKVLKIEDSMATGFFISADGLFLTNHHVFSMDNCPTGQCEDALIIRDFEDGGDQQVYRKYKILAASGRPLDFALLKVDLGKDETVPYIPISMELPEKIRNGEEELEMIGHPQGASQQVSRADVVSVSRTGILTLNSLGLAGNSGSPLLFDGKVLALYHSAGDEMESADLKTGFYNNYGYATRISEIVSMLTVLFPHLEEKDPQNWTAELFTDKKLEDAAKREEIAHYLPRKIEKWSDEDSKNDPTDAFFRNHYRSKNSADEIYRVHRILSKKHVKSLKNSELTNFYSSIIAADRFSGLKSQLPKEVSLDSLVPSKDAEKIVSGDGVYLLFLRQFGDLSYEACAKKVAEWIKSPGYGALASLRLRWCVISGDNKEAEELTREIFDNVDVSSDDRPFQSYLFNLVYALYSSYTMGATATYPNQLRAVEVLQHIQDSAATYDLKAYADSLRTMVKNGGTHLFRNE